MTDAERRLAWLVVSGWDNREIAQAVAATPHQVKTHLEALLDKLGLEDRLTLVLAAVAHDLQIPSRDCRTRKRNIQHGRVS